MNPYKPHVRSILTDTYPVPSVAPDKNGRTDMDRRRPKPVDPGSMGFSAEVDGFGKGDILSVPWYSSILHPGTIAKFEIDSMMTHHGPLYPIRRLFVIIWLFAESALCLPLYSFGLQGVRCRPPQVRGDYVGLRDVRAEPGPEAHQGETPYVSVRCNGTKLMHPKAVVHMLGSAEINFKCDIDRVGRLPEESYFKLVNLHEEAGRYAQDLPWWKRITPEQIPAVGHQI